MSLLQVGFPRSGNFWLYRIVESVLARAGVARRRFIDGHVMQQKARDWDLGGPERADMDVIDIEPEGCYFRIANRYRERIEDLEAYRRRSGHTCTHSPWCAFSATVLAGFDRAVYIVRDPRDAILSQSHYAFSDYMRRNRPPAEKGPSHYLARRHRRLARAWSRHVGGYLEHCRAGRLHLIAFERLVASFDDELAALLGYLGSDYLGVELDGEARRRIADEVSFPSMREAAPGHVRRGVVGGWKEGLTTAQERRIRRITGETMSALGYT